MTSNATIRPLFALLLAVLFTACDSGSFLEPEGFELEEEILFSLSPVGLTIAVGETVAVNASIANAGGKSVNSQALKWESSAPPVATVDGDGRVTGVTPGEALVVARSGSRRDTTLVLVTSAVAESGVRISPQVVELAWIGARGTLTAQAYTEEGTLVADPQITWTSLDPDIVEVDDMGELTANKIGTALIVAACAACGAPDTASAQVFQDVDLVQVYPSTPTLDTGDSLQLSAIAFDRGGTDIEGVSFSWSSSQPTVATVTQSGAVAAGSDGSTDVRATTDSHTGLSAVTVGPNDSDLGGQATDFTSAVQKWNDNFVRYGDMHWEHEQANPGAGLNYYDRASFWYRRGLPGRGDFTLRHYLDGMVFQSGADDLDASMAPRNWSGEGVMMAWERAGRPEIVKGQNIGWAAYSMAVEMMYDWAYSSNGSKRVDGDHPDGLWEGRISERALLAPLLAMSYGLPAPPPNRGTSSGTPAPATWADGARHTLELILRAQEPAGNWPMPKVHDSGERQINYMVAILLDALTRYYEEFEQDPRLPDVIQRSVDYLWTQWDSEAGGFPYYDNNDGGKPDLNLLFVSAWGFVYQQTGDDRYRQQGDRIFTEGVNRAWINQVSAVKQFNQQYRSAHRYIERTR